jgi:hypothetical protein
MSLIEIGDLVEFDIVRKVGIVLNLKRAKVFNPEEINDVDVLWCDGERFWCLDFTLKVVTNKGT